MFNRLTIYILLTFGLSLLQAQFDVVEPTGLPYHVIIQNAQLDGFNAPVGSTIGLFDGGICVGSAMIQNNQENLDIVVWEEDTWSNLQGFNSNSTIHAQLHTFLYGQEIIVNSDIEVVLGDGTYGYGSYTVINLNNESGLINSLELSEIDLLFEPTTMGEMSVRSLFIANTGNVRTLITSFQLNSSIFQIQSMVDSISAGSTEEIIIEFTPNQNIAYDTQLTLNTDSYETGQVVVNISGLGLQVALPVLEISESQVIFEPIPEENFYQKQVVLTNTGSSNLVISSIQLSEGSNFEVASNLNEIGPGQSFPLNIVFDPMTAGTVSDVLFIFSNANNGSQQSIYLEGYSFSSAFNPVNPTGYPYHIVVSELSVDGNSFQIDDEIAVFQEDLCVGSFFVNNQIEQASIVVWKENTNSGLPGYTNGTPFTCKIKTTSYGIPVILDLGLTLIQGDGTFGYGEFSVVALDANSGLEPVLNTSEPMVMFPPTQIGQEYVKILSLFNIGQTNLILSDLTVSDDIFLVSIQENIILPGDQKEIEILFNPTDAIPYSETLNIHSNDPLNPVLTIDLAGQGLPVQESELTADATLINLEPTSVGDTNFVNLNLFNSGSGILNILSIDVSNNNFFLLNSDISVIQPGESLDAVIGFTPADTGPYSCTVSIENTSINNPVFSVQINGTAFEGFFNSVEPTGLPYLVVIEDIINNSDVLIQSGDEIGIFDGSVCVGFIVVSEENPLSGVSWELNSIGENMPGFVIGNSIQLRYFSRRNDVPEVRAIEAVFHEGGFFGEGPYSSAEITLNNNIISPFVIGDLPSIEVDEDEGEVNIPIDLNEYFFHPYGDPLSYQVIFEQGILDSISYDSNGLNLLSSPNSFGLTSFIIRAFDGHIYTDAPVNLVINNVNDAPSINPIGNYITNEDISFSVELNILDVDEDELFITAIDSNNLSIVEIIENNIYLTPIENIFGTSTVSIFVNDGFLIDSTSFSYEILSVNDSPQILSPGDLQFPEDSSLSVVLDIYDVDGDDLTIEVSSNNNQLIVTLTDSILSLSSELNWFGSSVVEINVTDGFLENSLSFSVEVFNVDDPPILISSLDSLILIEDGMDTNFVDLDTLFYDIDNGLEFECLLLDDELGLIILEDSKVFFQLSPNAYGETGIVLNAFNSSRESVSDTIPLVIIPVNDPPSLFELSQIDSIILSQTSLNEDTEFIWSVSNDIENDEVTYFFSLDIKDQNDNIIHSLDSAIVNNVLILENEVLLSLIGENSNAIFTLSWDVYAFDGSASTYANNGPQSIILDVGGMLKVDEILMLPQELFLEQNYPNPFNPSTRIRFSIPSFTDVEIVFHNILGELVNSVSLGGLQPGLHEFQWYGEADNGLHLSSGTYYYTIMTKNQRITRKLVLIK